MLVGRVDDDRVLEAKSVSQPTRQVDVDEPRIADLDAYQPAGPGAVEKAGHLESAERELVRDLNLGLAVDIVTARDRGSQDQLRRPSGEVAHASPTNAHVSGSAPIVARTIDCEPGHCQPIDRVRRGALICAAMDHIRCMVRAPAPIDGPASQLGPRTTTTGETVTRLTTRRTRLSVACLSLTALTLTACGGAGGGGEEEMPARAAKAAEPSTC